MTEIWWGKRTRLAERGKFEFAGDTVKGGGEEIGQRGEERRKGGQIKGMKGMKGECSESVLASGRSTKMNRKENQPDPTT